MPQTAITDFYHSRKRPASEDLVTSKSKIAHSSRSTSNPFELCLKNETVHLNASKLEEAVSCITETVHLNASKLEEAVSCITSTSSPAVRKLDYCKETVTNDSPKIRTFSKKVTTLNISKDPTPSHDSKEVSSVAISRKELSLGDIRKRLAGSSRLAELKASADRLSKGIQQLKEKSNKRNLKEFKTIDVEVPTSPVKTYIRKELQTPKKKIQLDNYEHKALISPRKVFVSPVKSPNKVSAYVKLSSIASETSRLPLPYHYRFLAEVFRGMETVVSLLHNRNEKITFTKLKPSVQEMLKRNFTEKQLAQIKQLVPDFYTYDVQKVKTSNTSNQKESYELLVTPIFPNDIKIMSPSVLLERRRFFYDTLLQLTKKHHSEHLLKLDPPLIIEDSKLTRWHPEFELEKVPEVESAKMPEIPDVGKYSTAQDLLSKARELFKCNTKMERSLEKLAAAKARGLTKEEKEVINKTKTKVQAAETDQPSTSEVVILNPALRNLPTSLLEKVKAKQAAKALEAMTRSADKEKEYIIYSRLPDLARTLRNIFVTERKNVLALNIILSKLESSFKANISPNNMQRDIKLLAEEVPDLVKLHDIRGVSYVKLDKNANLKAIMDNLEKKAEEFKYD